MNDHDRDQPPWPPNMTRPQNRWQVKAGLRRWSQVNTAALRPRSLTDSQRFYDSRRLGASIRFTYFDAKPADMRAMYAGEP